jgi:site-specific recombinase XerD
VAADELAVRRAQKTLSGPAGVPIVSLLDSFQRSLDDRGVSPKTKDVHDRTGRQFTAWLERKNYPADTEGVDGKHIREFLGEEAARTSAVSAHQHYRNLRVLFKWMIREGEREAPNPMLKVDPPQVSRKVKPILAEEQLAALLRGCGGNDFVSRRDMAILRIFIDTGVRVSGLGGVRLDDVSLGRREIRVVLKGGDEHLIPLGRKATAALDRYLRSRARHGHASSEWLWLGVAGRNPAHFGTAGIQDMLERRAKDAQIDGKVTPHWLRRTFAHDWLSAGGSIHDGMRVAGWRTSAMMEHYAGDLAAERARAAHAQIAPGDRL